METMQPSSVSPQVARTSQPDEQRNATAAHNDVDFAAVKQRQQASWGAGDFSVIGSRILIVSEMLCESADLRSGTRVLDVACGHGNTALAAARRGAITTGLDYVPSMLSRARQRATAERLEVEWRDGDAEDLPFADATFDAVLSTFGVMFAPDQARAARELLRVCRSGGRLGLACWTPDGLVGDLFRVVGRYAPPASGTRPPTVWGTVDGLQLLLGDGVFDLHTMTRQFVQRFASAEHWVEVFRNWFGPIRTAFESLDASGQAELARELVALLNRYDRSGGTSLVAPSEYLEVVATRC